jgi:Tol biopolymer transport system component
VTCSCGTSVRFGFLIAWLALATAGTGAQGQTQAQLLQEGLRLLEAHGDARAALALFDQASHGTDRALAARAVLYTGVASERLGQERARSAYERVLRDYADQPDVVADARRRLARLTANEGHSTQPITLTLHRSMTRLPGNVVAFGAPLLDGRSVVYLDDEGRVGLADAETGERTRTLLDPSAPAPGLVAAAPDGSAVAVVRERPDGTTELAVTGVNGRAGLLVSLPDGATASTVDWTAPGRLVWQVLSPDGTAAIETMTTANGVIQEAARLAEGATRLATSPDGRWVAFDVPGGVDGVRRDVLVVAVGGGTPVPAAEDGGFPVWTADGQHLLFLSNRTGTTGLWAVAMVDGRPAGEPKLIAQDMGRVIDVLGVAGDVLHYIRQVGLVDVFTVPLDGTGHPTAPPRGAVTTFIGSNLGPDFSPDGRTLAFLAQMGFASRQVIGLRDADTAAYHTLGTGMRYLRTPRWAPDGHRLLVKGSDSAGRFGFHIIDVETGRVLPALTVTPREETELGAGRWGPDGRSLVYSRRRGERCVIVERDLATGHEQTLIEYPVDGVRGLRFETARDGTLVLLERRAMGGAVVLRGRDGARREVLAFGEADAVTGASFWPDGLSLLLERRSKRSGGAGDEAPIALWRLWLEHEKLESLGLERPGLRRACVSPNGGWLAFTAGAPTRETWVLENFQARLPRAPAANKERIPR